MILLFAVLAAGLTLASDSFRFQPEFIPRVLPALLAGILPILWFVIPKKVNPLIFLRLNHISLRTAGLALAAGALLGVFFRSLLLTLSSVPIAPLLPEFLHSLPPGGRGRLLELAGILGAGLFAFGVAGNLLVMRRSSLQILLPTLLFALLPPGYPDILWKLPVGFTAAVLFAADCSLLSPLLLIIAFALTSELGIPLLRLPVAWQGIQGVAVTTLLLGAAIVLAVIPGTGGRAPSGERLYFSGTINREGQPLLWSPNIGIVIVIFSLIGAAGLFFLFLAAA
jgi:hypothetical protein